MHESGRVIELDSPVIVLSDIKINSLQIENSKSMVKDQIQRPPTQPATLPVLPSDQNAQTGVSRNPIDVAQVNQPAKRLVGSIHDTQHALVNAFSRYRPLDKFGFHDMRHRKSKTQNPITDRRIIAPCDRRRHIDGLEWPQPDGLVLKLLELRSPIRHGAPTKVEAS